MSKFVNSVVLGLVSFILILAVFWYVVEIRQDSKVEIKDITASWGTSNSRSSEIKLQLAVYNPHKSPVELREIRYSVLVNGNQVTEGVANDTVTIDPESDGGQTFQTSIPSRFVVDWIDSHLENDERTTMKIRGEAEFSISTLLTVSPFEWESKWDGQYVRSLAGALLNCPSRGTEPCIETATAGWNTNGTQSAVDLSFGLLNPNAHPMRVKSWSVDLLFENRTVARGGAQETFSLAPNGNAVIASPITFDRIPLPSWWPDHLKQCERSKTMVIIKFLVEEDRATTNGTIETLVTSITWQFVGPMFETHFFCGAAA